MSSLMRALGRLLSRVNRLLHRWEGPIDSAPKLAGLAAVAACLDLAVGRFVLRLTNTSLAHRLSLPWWTDAVRSVAAVAGLTALLGGVLGLLLFRSGFGFFRAIMVATAAGIFTTMLGFALCVPAEGPLQIIGPLTAAAGALLTFQLAVSGLALGAPRSHLVGSLLLSILGLAMFVHIISDFASRVIVSGSLIQVAGGLKESLETPYLLLLSAPALMLPKRLQRIWAVTALVLTLVAAYLAAFHPSWLSPSHVTLFEGAFDLRLFPDSRGALTALAVTLGLAACTLGLFAHDKSTRQSALGFLLLTAGGFFPRTPSRVLMWAVAALLTSRSALSKAAQARPSDR